MELEMKPFHILERRNDLSKQVADDYDKIR